MTAILIWVGVGFGTLVCGACCGSLLTGMYYKHKYSDKTHTETTYRYTSGDETVELSQLYTGHTQTTKSGMRNGLENRTTEKLAEGAVGAFNGMLNAAGMGAPAAGSGQGEVELSGREGVGDIISGLSRSRSPSSASKNGTAQGAVNGLLSSAGLNSLSGGGGGNPEEIDSPSGRGNGEQLPYALTRSRCPSSASKGEPSPSPRSLGGDRDQVAPSPLQLRGMFSVSEDGQPMVPSFSPKLGGRGSQLSPRFSKFFPFSLSQKDGQEKVEEGGLANGRPRTSSASSLDRSGAGVLDDGDPPTPTYHLLPPKKLPTLAHSASEPFDFGRLSSADSIVGDGGSEPSSPKPTRSSSFGPGDSSPKHHNLYYDRPPSTRPLKLPPSVEGGSPRDGSSSPYVQKAISKVKDSSPRDEAPESVREGAESSIGRKSPLSPKYATLTIHPQPAVAEEPETPPVGGRSLRDESENGLVQGGGQSPSMLYQNFSPILGRLRAESSGGSISQQNVGESPEVIPFRAPTSQSAKYSAGYSTPRGDKPLNSSQEVDRAPSPSSSKYFATPRGGHKVFDNEDAVEPEAGRAPTPQSAKQPHSPSSPGRVKQLALLYGKTVEFADSALGQKVIQFGKQALPIVGGMLKMAVDEVTLQNDKMGDESPDGQGLRSVGEVYGDNGDIV